MAVKIGSARVDENGHASGGKAGDQTGKEVSTQSWYKHNKVWRVFRAKNPEQAEKIAQDMQWACDNKHIGYDQGQRLTLYDVAKAVDFNCKLVSKDCETDCSAIVRVCCAYAGIMLPNFRTPTEPKVLLDSGAFTELKGARYSDSSAYLRRGDILCTSTQGHTVVVLTNGSKADADPTPDPIGDRDLKNGCEGADVKQLQQNLISLGFSCGKYGADGDFGDCTELAVEAFQRANGLPETGIYDAVTREAMKAALDKADKPAEAPRDVKIVGGNCYVRTAPSTDGRKLGVAHDGDVLPYQGQTSDNGWHLIEYKGQNGWVSGKYGRLID